MAIILKYIEENSSAKIEKVRIMQYLQSDNWNAALYTRLSQDDPDSSESNSILGQKRLLNKHAENIMNLSIVKIYSDDGFSGTNFQRPDFQNMMNDIRTGKVNCVIVKDLSRFGRDYIESGSYTEKIFPALGVRFISISEGLDSMERPEQMNSMLFGFTNLIKMLMQETYLEKLEQDYHQ